MQCDEMVEEDNEGTAEDTDTKRKLEEGIDRKKEEEEGMDDLKAVTYEGILHNSHMEIENWNPLMYNKNYNFSSHITNKHYRG